MQVLFPASTGFLREDVCQIKVGNPGSCLNSEPEWYWIIQHRMCKSNQNSFGLYKVPHLLNKIWIQLFYLLFKELVLQDWLSNKSNNILVQQNNSYPRGVIAICALILKFETRSGYTTWNSEHLKDTHKHIHYLQFWGKGMNMSGTFEHLSSRVRLYHK